VPNTVNGLVLVFAPSTALITTAAVWLAGVYVDVLPVAGLNDPPAPPSPHVTVPDGAVAVNMGFGVAPRIRYNASDAALLPARYAVMLVASVIPLLIFYLARQTFTD
jgi:hypothetical protein